MELADTSAWTNRAKRADVEREFDQLLAQGEIATCEMVAMELLWTAVDHDDFRSLRTELGALVQCPIGTEIWAKAIEAFEAFAARGPLHHRQVPIQDLVIAAAAQAAGFPVCHYDAHFELIAEVTGQPVRAIAPLGSLE